MPRPDSIILRNARLMIPRLVISTAILGAALSLPLAAETNSAESAIKDLDRNIVGTAVLTETHDGVLLQAQLSGLPSGERAIHFHETGKCEPPFDSAGDHLTAKDAESHGHLHEDGPHLGDLPNIDIPEGGQLDIEVMTLISNLDEQVFDDDGAALVIHEGADDYVTQPDGGAGSRIACGVIEKREE